MTVAITFVFFENVSISTSNQPILVTHRSPRVRMLKMTGFKHTITQALEVEMGSTMCSEYMSC